MNKTTKNGFTLYEPDKYHKNARLFCRDTAKALEDIRELLTAGQTFEAVNDYDTFYGCGWGAWLINGTKDIATAEVTSRWNPGGYCNEPFPCSILLTPKTA